ncbi:MAG TPA: glucosaminidase domain-containing protein [Candidatus Avacidaminococcus intestinavium]|uniref:Glucosaminidase domain-containing protein n=1 Tax=Candidatus Avacidaminococcus intestinavium TaxID=2840684 RepID=A0A9D1MQ53_9FIRM|nr:glucosaminidase domain-containing protein [Candidatus Avacidaminococcus intestinavium]
MYNLKKIFVAFCLFCSVNHLVFATPSSVDYVEESVTQELNKNSIHEINEEKMDNYREQKPFQRAKNKEKTKILPQKKHKLPVNYQKISIFGTAMIPEKQAVAFLKKVAPKLKIKASHEEIVRYYYEESAQEGIRGDIAFCQALLETGFFQFRGTVQPMQNNFCGLGTTGSGVKGAKFKTPRVGVRAHIQHLLAYASDKRPKSTIVDPRFDLVQKMRKTRGYLTTWHSLNGNWAMSPGYSEKIFMLHNKMSETIF